MKLNQKGALDMMLVAALAVVLVVGGFVLVRISESDEDLSTNTTETEIEDTNETTSPPLDARDTEEEKVENEVTKTELEFEEGSLSVEIPEGWSTEASTDAGIWQLHELTSTDHMMSEGAYPGTTQGIKITISQSVTNDTTIQDIIDGKGQLVGGLSVGDVVSGASASDVDGNPAVSYGWAWEGPSRVVVAFDNNDFRYQVYIENELMVENTANVDLFYDIVNSIEVN